MGIGNVISVNTRWLLCAVMGAALFCHSMRAEDQAVPRSLNLNPVWKFMLGTDLQEQAVDPKFHDASWKTVAVPHTLEEVRLNSASRCSKVGWYRKHLALKGVDPSKKYFLHFEGVMQTTEVWVNAKPIGKYEVSGYDSFHFDITDALKDGKNLITVKVDNRSNRDIPPDGQKMDFVLFGGLYRDVNLVTTGKVYVTFPWEARDAGIRITTPEASEASSTVKVDTTVRNATAAPVDCKLLTEIVDKDGKVVSSFTSKQAIQPATVATFRQALPPIKGAKLWGPDSPYLYMAVTTVSVGGRVMDRLETQFGIRTFKFTKDKGFFLNGKHLKLVGANRHQTWPYVGNAVPNSMHRKDAKMMKAAGMNWVRLSHYPHDPAFLDACDELGMMALEEGPTWMKTGGPAWMKNLDKSFRSMIRRDRNHPSIIVWNACVNHGGPRDFLVKACKEEDYRPAAAAFPRTPMDFKHGKISGGGALTIEHTGHTYPRYRGQMAFEGMGRRSGKAGKDKKAVTGDWQLAKRHWEHTNAAYRKQDNSGLAVWCMFDYNTNHNTTERGMVWHGVCDLQRIPKESYYWHISELTQAPMAYVMKYSDVGVTVVSNCEEIELFQDTGDGMKALKRSKPDTGFALTHPPFSFDVSSEAKAVKAVGYRDGKKVAEHTWREPGKAMALTVETDRPSIVADGSDFARIIVTAVDANGTVVPDYPGQVTLDLKGPGRLIGDHPFKLRKGKFAVLAAAFYEAGTITVEAKASGLKPNVVRLPVVPLTGNVYLPDTMPRTAAASGGNTPNTAGDSEPGGKATGKSAATDPEGFELPPVVNATPGAWVVSEDVMVTGKQKQYMIEVTGGEYQIYARPYTSKTGAVIPGDATRVRVRASKKAGDTVTATLRIGNVTRTFKVTTKRK